MKILGNSKDRSHYCLRSCKHLLIWFDFCRNLTVLNNEFQWLFVNLFFFLYISIFYETLILPKGLLQTSDIARSPYLKSYLHYSEMVRNWSWLLWTSISQSRINPTQSLALENYGSWSSQTNKLEPHRYLHEGFNVQYIKVPENIF